MSLFSRLFKWNMQSQNVTSVDGLTGAELTDAILHNLVAEGKLPGMSVSIRQGATVLLEKGYGFANLEQGTVINPQESIFRTASVSKCITGLAFGKMVEDGILGWDDSFYKHVPYFPKKTYDFTLRQLASHTAGIRKYKGKEFALNQPFTIRESLRVFQDDALVFQPGRGYLYTSFDFVLLSLAMQEACGMPFEDYVQKKVLHPLGMHNTFSPKAEFPAERLVNFYTKTASGFKEAVPVDNFYKLAGGGYVSTATDIAMLGEAILVQSLLQSETYGQLLQAQLVHGKSTYYGLGFQVSQDEKGRAFYGHVGSSVGAYSNLFVYPKEKLVISILVNCTDPKVQAYLNEAINTVLETQSIL